MRMEQNQKTRRDRPIQETITSTQENATTALLYESETDQQQYQKLYDRLATNSKSFRKPKHHDSLTKPKSNRITPFQQQEQEILPSKSKEQTSNRKNNTSSHLLQSNYEFWRERHYTKTDKFCERAWREKYESAERPLCLKEPTRKDMKMSKVIINRVGFNDIFPRENCFYGKKVGKELHSKRKAQLQPTQKKVCAVQKIGTQGNETFTMEIRKITRPSVRIPSHSLPLKIQDKIQDFIIESSKKIRLSYDNQGKYIHQQYRHKFKHKKHRSDTFLMALSRPKLTPQNSKGSKPLENSIENRYNLANIFRKLKELRNADIIETEKRKESHSQHQQQPKLTKIQHTFSDKAIYADKTTQKYKAMKNGFRICTQGSKQQRDMLQIERMIDLPQRRLLSQIYFNDQFNSQ